MVSIENPELSRFGQLFEFADEYSLSELAERVGDDASVSDERVQVEVFSAHDRSVVVDFTESGGEFRYSVGPSADVGFEPVLPEFWSEFEGIVDDAGVELESERWIASVLCDYEGDSEEAASEVESMIAGGWGEIADGHSRGSAEQVELDVEGFDMVLFVSVAGRVLVTVTGFEMEYASEEELERVVTRLVRAVNDELESA